MSIKATDVYGSLSSQIKGLASGYDHATKTGPDTFDIYFTDGSKVGVTVALPNVDDATLETIVNQIIANNPDDFKGADGKTVYIGDVADAPEEAVLVFDPSETTGTGSYTKTESDTKYAKAVDVGDITKLKVGSVADLVDAINTVYSLGASKFQYSNKCVNVTTRGGKVIPIDCTSIITDTNIDEFKNVLISAVADGDALVYDLATKKWKNKQIDSVSVLDSAKEYTDNAIAKLNNADAIAVDEKPTISGDTITYVKDGVTLTTDNVNTWFYYTSGAKTVQTIWVDGKEFTLDVTGGADFNEYLKKEHVTDTVNDADKTKIPTLQALFEIHEKMNESLGDKVNVDDIVDAFNSESTDRPASARTVKELKSQIDDIIDDSAESETTTYSSKKTKEKFDKVDEVLAELHANAIINEAVGSNIHVSDSAEGNVIVSRAPKNLLNHTLESLKPYNTYGTWSGNVFTHTNGATFTFNPDGSITVNGMVQNEASIFYLTGIRTISTFYLRAKPYIFSTVFVDKNGNTLVDNTHNVYTIWARTSATTGSYEALKYIMNSNNYFKYEVKPIDTNVGWDFRIEVAANTTVDNITVYPMLEEVYEGQTEPSAYVPHAGYDIVSCGKNFSDNSDTVYSSNNTNGMSFILNQDGSVIINGTNTRGSTSYPCFKDNMTLPKGNYVIPNCRPYAGLHFYMYNVTDSVNVDREEKNDNCYYTITEEMSKTKKFRLCASVQNGTSFNNLAIYPMICRAEETDLTYESYKESRVSITPDTEFPVYGLKSFDGVTNIQNQFDADMEVQYPLNQSGASILSFADKCALKSQISNPNLLDNPWFTINQRGSTEVNKTDYVVDRWLFQNESSKAKAKLENGSLTLTTKNNDGIYQIIDFSLAIGKTYTMSFDDGVTIRSKSFVWTGKDIISNYDNDDIVNFAIVVKNSRLLVYPYIQYSDTIVNTKIVSVKLEVGSASTLKNDVPPNYQTELLKCMRYYQVLKGDNTIVNDVVCGTANVLYVPFRFTVPMRAKPTFTCSANPKYGKTSVNTGSVASGFVLSSGNETCAELKLTGTCEVGSMYRVGFNGNSKWEFSAEL